MMFDFFYKTRVAWEIEKKRYKLFEIREKFWESLLKQEKGLTCKEEVNWTLREGQIRKLENGHEDSDQCF
jgi:hypothetical protein